MLMESPIIHRSGFLLVCSSLHYTRMPEIVTQQCQDPLYAHTMLYTSEGHSSPAVVLETLNISTQLFGAFGGQSMDGCIKF
jgi:hypothetical protein